MSAFVALALQAALSGMPHDLTEGCNDKEGTIALSSCYSRHADAWQKRLEAAYSVTINHVEEPQRKALRNAQAAWLKYRDAACTFYDLVPGSLHYIQGAYCMLDLTRHRALELEEYGRP